jgi:tetratricopeptide (TPR) repeat protein
MTKYFKWMFLALTFCNCVHAQQPVDVVTLIRRHEFVALEEYFNAIEASFEHGRTSEFALVDAYKPLYMRNDELSDDLAAWTAMYPKSYAAHVARGTYYRKLGELNRGTSFAVDVPKSTMSYMQRVFDTAEEELTTALPLTKKPYLALLNLLNIARYRSDNHASDRYLSAGNKVFPGNVLLRVRYLDHLKPRWGGSYEAMTAFVARCKKEGLSHTKLGLLSAMINDDKGLTAQLRGDTKEAKVQYQLALNSAEGSSVRLKADYLEDSLNACSRRWVTCGQSEQPVVDYHVNGFGTKSRCAEVVGSGCVGALQMWAETVNSEPWARGCNLGDETFCAWCRNNAHTVFYNKGIVADPHDCDLPETR